MKLGDASRCIFDKYPQDFFEKNIPVIRAQSSEIFNCFTIDNGALRHGKNLVGRVLYGKPQPFPESGSGLILQ